MNNPVSSVNLLTPIQAAQRLLEEATLQAYRTNGASGLRPVLANGRHMFRQADIEGFVRATLAV